MRSVSKDDLLFKKIINRYQDLKARKSSLIIEKFGLIVAVIALLVFFTLMSPKFISSYNLFNIARQMVSLSLLAIGLTFVLVGSGVDLSVGANMSLVSVILANTMIQTKSIAIAVVVGLLVGLSFGFINGYIVAYRNVQPFAVTLGTMSVGNGIALLLSSGNTIRGLPESFAALGNGTTLGVPNQVWILVVIVIIAYIVLQKTPFGSRCYAVGGNQGAAYLSGITVKKIRMQTFVICGFLASVASIIASSRIVSGNPTLGADITLQAVAASVIGGASMSGGRGNIGGTIIGCIFISVLYSGLNFIKVSPYVQDLLIGLVIVGSAWIDANKRRKSG
jgi:ribose/xylose/arabinose/galactoside ABC-type transport system permease subunit